MQIKDILKFQEEFDSRHHSKFNWNEKLNDNNTEILQFLMLCLMGEIGEVSNLAKKMVRGDFPLHSKKDELAEELTDVFIYLIKLFNQLEINIEEEYFKKMRKNESRFKKYEKKNTRNSL